MNAARREPVVAHRVRVEVRDTGVFLSCQLRGHDGELPSQLWFRLPSELRPFVEAVGDPFLPPLLIFCMHAGIPLVIEADVSALLLAAVPRIQDVYCAWAGERADRLTRTKVTARASVRPRHGSSSAAFFSCGVDSFYTLLRNVRRYPSGDSRFVQHLVLVHGFDVPLRDHALFGEVERQALHAAQHFGRNLLTVATNIRSATDVVDWAQYGHGAALAAVGLALGPMVHTVFIPATAAFVDLKPWGSHPGLDPLWSTEQIEFVNDGGEARREEKVHVIASSPAALQSLRVCWENRGGAYNCGRCEKCLRTMIELRLCEALERAAQFPQAIEPDHVARLTIPEGCLKHWHRMLARRERLSSPELAAAIETALERSRVTRPIPVRIGRAVARGLSRIERLRRRVAGG